MGQQMGKEAEPPLICSMENPESGHTQRPEGGRKRERDKHSKTGRAATKRFRATYGLLLGPTTLLWPPGRRIYIYKYILIPQA